jgi:redox-sensitive bicupin YhaK (pirin superfamily)
MITMRRSDERGHANHGWLDSFHSFSFADYYDPSHMGFGPLRVINEDRVEPGMGFGTHGHRDMEIVSYVLDGQLEHKDSMGTGSIIVPGDVQRMSAGKGVLHSEFNPSRERKVHFLQIWIEPAVRGIAPSYEQANVPSDAKRGRLALIAGPEGSGAAVAIHQDAKLFATLLDGTERVMHTLAPGRRAYVHVARGRVQANGHALGTGDAARFEGETSIALEHGEAAEVLVFDLP